MSDRAEPQAVPIEPTFDRTPQPFDGSLPDPIVYDGSARAVRPAHGEFRRQEALCRHAVCLQRTRPRNSGPAFSLARGHAARRFDPAASRRRPSRAGRGAGGSDRHRDGRRGPAGHHHLERSGVRPPDRRRGDRPAELRRHPADPTCGAGLRSDADRAALPGSGNAGRWARRSNRQHHRSSWLPRSRRSLRIRPAPTAS